MGSRLACMHERQYTHYVICSDFTSLSSMYFKYLITSWSCALALFNWLIYNRPCSINCNVIAFSKQTWWWRHNGFGVFTFSTCTHCLFIPFSTAWRWEQYDIVHLSSKWKHFTCMHAWMTIIIIIIIHYTQLLSAVALPFWPPTVEVLTLWTGSVEYWSLSDDRDLLSRSSVNNSVIEFVETIKPDNEVFTMESES